MTSKASNDQSDQYLTMCEVEIQLQNIIFDQIVNSISDISQNVSEMFAREIELNDYQSQYNMLCELIQNEMKIQQDLKSQIAEISKELDESTYVEEKKSHVMLENLVDQKNRKLRNKLGKKLNNDQVADFQKRSAQLEQEKQYSFRQGKLNQELESVQLEHRELTAIYEQKKKRYDFLKSSHDVVVKQRNELMAKKEELQQELDEYQKDDTTSYDESSDDDDDIHLIL